MKTSTKVTSGFLWRKWWPHKWPERHGPPEEAHFLAVGDLPEDELDSVVSDPRRPTSGDDE